MKHRMGRKAVYGLIFGLLALVFLGWWTDPRVKTAGTVIIYDRSGEIIYEAAGGVKMNEPVELARMPEALKKGVVLIEDKRYWKHKGVDLLASLRALGQNLKARGVVAGGSTIPQQLVRFTVISPQTPARVSLLRKAREALMAVRLSLTRGKEEILADYLNTMHFGHDAYGVGAAAKLYFGKEVEKLSLAQAATLTGMIANPARYDPVYQVEAALARRNSVLGKMVGEKLIGEEAYERALAEPLPEALNLPEITAPHFARMVIEELQEAGIDSRGGLRVFTTLDKDLYKLTLEVARLQVGKLSQKHDLSNAAVVVLENQSGRIAALLGSVDYFNREIGGENNMALVLRQPGSALKPVTYAAAFELSLATPATVISDEPKVYATSDGEGFLPHNYDGRYRGRVLAREALASSYNLPAVEMLSRVGIDNFLKLIREMGVTSLRERERYDLALTLGGGEINLLELSNVYATLARGGEFMPVHFIERVEGVGGKVLYEYRAEEGRRVVSEETAYLITDILGDPKARIPTFGEKNLLVLDWPAAVKTGTTTDWHDNWTVGYTPKYTVGVWVGNADNAPMREISGITGAAPIWNQVFAEILKYEGSEPFEEPLGIIKKEICAWDGLLPGEKCGERYIEIFRKGSEPSEYSELTARNEGRAGLGEIQIINPKNLADYEVGVIKDEEIVFETGERMGVVDVRWNLDGGWLSGEECGKEDRRRCFWKPIGGEHRLFAVVEFEDGRLIETGSVKFRVLGYKQDW